MAFSGIGERDRVLCFDLTDLNEIAALVKAVAAGMVVVASESDAFIESGRQALAEYENIMFLPVDESGTIPWRDAIFTAVIAPAHQAATNEMRRVLAAGGRIFLSDGVIQL